MQNSPLKNTIHHKSRKTITEVVSRNLCCGCGGCIGICPSGSLSGNFPHTHEPVMCVETCINCGLCYDICPGKGYPVHRMAKKSEADDVIFHPKYGPVQGYYRGHAADTEIRKSGASGGAATALMLYLLESGIVECVVVPVFKDGCYKPAITSSPEDILAAHGSKYVPIPVADIISEFKANPRRFAMTCTPCQLAAWKMAEEKIQSLRGCLVFAAGLFCGYVQSYEAISCLAKIMQVDYPATADFAGWRCGDYPGNTRFITASGDTVDKPYYASANVFIPYFSLKRCFSCADGGNMLADIVMGDIHSSGTDETVILCRTNHGKAVLENAAAAGIVIIHKEDEAFAAQTSINGLNIAKLLPAQAAAKAIKLNDMPLFDVPDMFAEYPELLRMKKYWRLRYRLYCIIRKNRVRKILERYPALLENIGGFIYSFPWSLPGWKYKEFILRLIRNIAGRK